MYYKERVSRELCSKCNLENRYNTTENTVEFYKKHCRNKNITKLERNRFSILTNNLDKCIIFGCENKKEHLHEVFPGRNRTNSMKYGCVIPLCAKHHREIHENIELAAYYKILAQQRFNEAYPYLSFIEIFKRSYL